MARSIDPIVSFYRSTLQSTDRAVRTVWRDPRAAEQPRAREAVLRKILGLVDDARQLEQYVLDAFAANRIADHQDMGESLQSYFQTQRSVLEFYRSQAAAAGLAGPAGEILKAVEEINRIEDRLLKHWPWALTKEDEEKVLDEFRRGECPDLDEAFAQIAGVSREVWKERVEAYRRTRRS